MFNAAVHPVKSQAGPSSAQVRSWGLTNKSETNRDTVKRFLDSVPSAELAISAESTRVVSSEHCIIRFCATIYLGCTIFGAIYFLKLVFPMLENDLLWMSFSPTEAQSYLIDTFNKALQTQLDNPVFDLFDPGYATLTLYGSMASTTALNLYPAYVRQCSQWDQITLDHAIANFRLVDAATSFYTFIEFCYVDLERRWETAHTAGRAARCARDQTKNAAVYMETMLRNLIWYDFMLSWGDEFNYTVMRYVSATAEGSGWLARTKNAYKDEKSELAHWKKYGLTYYQTLWHNHYISGIDEKMVITNALGLESTITLKHISYSDRRALWTTVIQFWGPYNDAGYTAYVHGSWVRQAPDYMENIGAGTYEDALMLYPNTPASVIIHNMWGPFLSIDNYLQGPVSSLTTLVGQFDAFIMKQFGSSAVFRIAYNAIADTALDIIPLGWRASDSVHYGGSPMCAFSGGTTFIQAQFSWDDSCSSDIEAIFKVAPAAILFGYAMSGSPTLTSVCKLALTKGAECTGVVAAAKVAWNVLTTNDPTSTNNLVSASAATTIDIKAMFIEVVQNSKVKSNYTVLRQTLLSSTPYDIFGWMQLFDWAHGIREVVSFQGDVATFVLMSEPLVPHQFMALPLEVPRASCVYLWAICIFTTLGLVGIGIATVFYIIIDRFAYHSWHLLFFNRIVGPVWVGRPLLLARAFTALLALSTAPVDFVIVNDQSKFKYATRSWFASFILTAEATWLTYVVNDFLLVFASDLSVLYAPTSSLMVWVITFAWDVTAPVQVTASLTRNCTQTNIDRQVTCTSGSVSIEHRSRLISTILINIGCIAIALLITFIAKYKLKWSRPQANLPLLVPACGATFINTTYETMSSSTAVMCGLFTATIRGSKWVFDTKLWIIFNASTTVVERDLAARKDTLKSRAMTGSANLMDLTKPRPKPVHRYYFSFFDKRIKIIGGTMYMLSSLLGSVTELKSFTDPSTPTEYSSIYIRSSMYDSGKDLSNVVNGIRNTDACKLPWISTQYCYVDFDMKWEMANSATRQLRCKNYVDNGAVFLESILRNMNWTTFNSCWGYSYKLAKAAATISPLDITQEVDYWASKNILRYATQWQNYKTHGMIDKFLIQNAFGLLYPMTLKSTNGTFRLASLKMYWAWASDLWAIATPNTLMTGASLLRHSSTHRGAFTDKNLTMEQVLVQNGTFRWPLRIGYEIFHNSIGPFGSVDLWYVSTPSPLTLWFAQANAIIADVLSTTILTVGGVNITFPAQLDLLAISPPSQMFPVPPPMGIKTEASWGGNLLCHEKPTTAPLDSGLWALTGVDTACSTALGEGFLADRMNMLFSVLASGVAIGGTSANCYATCQFEMDSHDNCHLAVFSIAKWALKYIGNKTLESLRAQALTVQNDVSILKVELAQYAQKIATHENHILRSPIVASTPGVFDFFGWMYLSHWASGIREVIKFEGDIDSISVITARIDKSSFVVNAQEIPINASFYFRSLCQYITAVLICVSIAVLIQSAVHEFQNEGWNYFEMNRVAGIVWVGRPLLFVRSMTALALLSTGSLELTNFGNTAVLISTATKWYTTTLAAGEVGWLIYIVNDITMLYTKNLTMHYTTTVGILTWFIAAVLSLASPVVPVVQIQKQCQVAQIDFQLVCTSGVVYIGDFTRFLTLVGIGIGISFAGVIVVRLVHGPPKDTDELISFMLPCGAKYLYDKELWIHENVYYMDLASAVMAGLLILPIHGTFYVFDVKSWRIVHVPGVRSTSSLRQHPEAKALCAAFPMVI
ncbi:hypothetical protein THRCLA_09056 [Thraustotheca clavata]|uniref:Transmembrane protein n=1 Tax=Thraustotheca clavata TaxID=74557 RepID=A0A1V9Z003_9STRA|nr:hypothetical protein THRCLA_09056 [Thraustotheca clavata]